MSIELLIGACAMWLVAILSLKLEKHVRVRSMILRNKYWSTNSSDRFRSLDEANEKYDELVRDWQGEIFEGTFFVELIDYDYPDHDKIVGR